MNFTHDISTGAMLVNTGGGVAALVQSNTSKAAAAQKAVDQNPKTKTGDVAFWGTNNLFPQDIIKLIDKSTVVKPALHKQANLLYSGGLVFGNLEGFDEQGNDIFKPSTGNDYKAISKYLKTIKVNRYLRTAPLDFYTFYNTWPSMAMSNDKKMIANLESYRSRDCRWGWQNEKTGLLDTVYYSKKWDEIRSQSVKDNEDVKTITAIDPSYDVVGQVQELKRSTYQFIYPISGPTHGGNFYELAPWDGMRTGRWLDVALSIPEFKIALMQNQMTVKYHIEIADDYWPAKIKEWDELTPAGKQSAKETVMKAFFKIMKGDKNSGNALITGFVRDEHQGKEFADWKVTVLDDKLKDGAYIEDSQEATYHLYTALGLDAKLTGVSPAKGIAPGSGSDIREAYNLYMSMAKAHQDLILDPLQFIAEFHAENRVKGWSDTLEFRFRNSLSVTLDKGAEKQVV